MHHSLVLSRYTNKKKLHRGMPLASKFIRTRKVPGMLASDAMVQNDHGRVSSYNGIMEHVKMLQVVMDQC